MNWTAINSRKDLKISTELFEPFADVLNWSNISESMEIQFTEELIEKYRNKWDWQSLRKNPQIIDKLGTTLSKYQSEFNCVEFLEKFDRTPYIYHYTHLYHAIDIINRKKIYSRNRAKELGLLKYDAASGTVVERTSKAHSFARFYFRPQTPTQFYNECLGMDSDSGKEGWVFGGYDYNGKKIWNKAWKSYYPQFRNLGLPRCPIPVFFKFDLKEVLIKMGNKCSYSTGNMQTNWASVEKVNKNPNSINTIHLYSDISDYENYKQYSQQEFLVSEEFEFSKLESFEIICYNDEYANLLKSQLGNDPICKKINSDGWNIFHRGNRELIIYETETEISITSEYRDSAYLSIKGEGLKNIEILNPERIQKETPSEIIAYPEIKFTKTEQPIEVHFVDNAIGTRDWLVYANKLISSGAKKTTINEYEIINDILSSFQQLESKLKIKLSKDLFYPQMVDSYHGIAHTSRVLFGTCLIVHHYPDIDESLKEGIYYSAIIHDLGKSSDTEGAIHGSKSEQLYKSKIGEFIPDVTIQSLVLSAIKYHSVEDRDCPISIQNNLIWKVLKDADALDRGRFSKKCDKSYLRLDLFKTDLGNLIISFMDELPHRTSQLSWNNPYTELTNCIKQIIK